MKSEVKTEMAKLNEKRNARLQEVKAELEGIINDTELFNPYDIIVLQQGSIQVYSTEVSLPLVTKD